MATTEEKVDKLEIKFATLEQQFAATMAKVDMVVGEMRDRDNQRAQDIREIRASIDGMGKQIHNLTIAAVVGFRAIALAVGGLVVSALK